MKRVHIVGAPRTGTTLMLELMITGFRFDWFSKTELRVVEPVPANARVTCTKFPRDVVLAKTLLAMDPEQYFIYLERDPRDVIVSVHNKAPDRYWVSLWYWRKAELSARELVGHPRFLVVRYENLTRAPDATQDELADKLPFLERLKSFSAFHESAEPSKESLQAMRSLRPVEASSIGAWRQHKPRIKGQIKLHGSPANELIALGYEQDATWEAELSDVEPDIRPGFWPEQMDAASRERAAQQQQAMLAAYARGRGFTLP